MLKHILLGRGEGEEGSRREKSINILELWISHLRGAPGFMSVWALSCCDQVSSVSAEVGQNIWGGKVWRWRAEGEIDGDELKVGRSGEEGRNVGFKSYFRGKNIWIKREGRSKRMRRRRPNMFYRVLSVFVIEEQIEQQNKSVNENTGFTTEQTLSLAYFM